MCGKLYPLNLNIDYFPTNFVVQNGKSIILIMNVITIWKNGILKTGE